MRVKAAKNEKKAKAAVRRGVGMEVSALGRPCGVGSLGTMGDGERELGKRFGKAHPEESESGLKGTGRRLSLQAGGPNQTRERSEGPPALPMPIASFTI